jgi:nucleotide-binding universal stress UspA family protein
MGGRQTLTLRVVEPGLLGIPRRLLIPIAGHPSGFRPGLPFLKLLAPDITQIHLLHVKQVRPAQLRRLTHEQSVSLRRAGVGLCTEAEREIIGALGHSKVMIDTHVVISDDVAKEIVIHAGKCKSRLIYMGASERSLAGQLILGSPLERVLRDAPCDVGVYRGLS